MKTIIITADGFEHRYVTNKLSNVLGRNLLAVIVEQHSKQRFSFKKLNDIKKRYGYLRILERIITKMVKKILREHQRQEEGLKKVLGQSALDFSFDCPVIAVSSANSSRSIELIEDIKPDYLFIYGTSVIKRKVLLMPLRVALNLHTGNSPYYRGSGTVFWPLLNKEPEMVGSTVHECTPDIDGGDIYGRISVKLNENDDHHTAFAKCVKEGANLYSNIAKRLVSGEKIQTQMQDFSIGKEYRFKDLTFVQELKMEYRRRNGSLRRLILQKKDEPPPNI